MDEINQLELKLKEAGEELEAVYEGIVDGMLIADIKTQTIVRFNTVILKMFGYSKNEFFPLQLINLFEGDYQADMVVMFKTMIPGRTEFTQNVPCRRKNGSIFYADVGMRQITFKQLFFNIIFFRDVTERKNILDKLEESEAKYHSIFNASSDLMVQIDLAGTIIDVNQKITSLAGYKPEDVIGKKINALADIFTAKSLTTIVANFGKRTLGFEVKPYEIEAKSKDGKSIFFEITAVPLKGQDNKNLGEVAILHDITAYKIKN